MAVQTRLVTTRIDADALVHFIKVRQRPAGIKLAAIAAVGGRTLDIVEQALGEIGGGSQILKPLLVLNADGVAAELIGDAQHGDVHAALVENLRVGQVGGFIRSRVETHAARVEPFANLLRFCVADLAHGRIERGLAEALLVDAGWVHQRIFDDGVGHAHAALIEDAQQRLLAAQFIGQRHAQSAFGLAHFGRIEGMHVRNVVREVPVLDPFTQPALEERVGEVLAP